ncbi:DUF4403 family protein [Erythrobacter litoralis]|uniref:DUF4403 family protein n=1 Tax=Erythrobacter litoralis (strain HTCC2594) TaxID=314225 RepID=Q2NCW4_ERYLH|nr:DUF4403 family protein [Erythrobacter litoralis]ABC62477.1 hypothetical protein ELI_01925 [Erythrobacter litoralis HTCC2594]
MRKAAILIGIIVALLAIAGGAAYYYLQTQVAIADYPRPVRSDTAPEIADGDTVLVTQVGIPLETIRRALEKDVPRRLYAIDRQMENCVPRRNIRVFGEDLGRTPKVACRITGQVRRGAISVVGRGDRLIARLPVNATVRARDIGGVIKQETATASAMMEVTVRISVGRSWQPRAAVDLDYRWTREPGIDILGQRITFTEPANRELRGVLREVERSLQREVAKIAIKPVVEKLWSRGFTTLSLSEDNPPVWLTIAPQEAGVGQFRVAGRQLIADVMVAARTRVKVGERPEDVQRKALGPNAGITEGGGFRAVVPVMADYAELEPVLLRELGKLADKGIKREDLGRLELEFEDVEIFATDDDRLAVGIVAEVVPVGRRTGRSWGRTRGEVWLTGRAATQAGSEVVRIEDLRIFGDMDAISGDVLIRIMRREEVRSAIEAALVEDFRQDYARIAEKVRAGLADVGSGDIRLSITVDAIDHGEVQVTGQGLYLPVEARGRVEADVAIR